MECDDREDGDMVFLEEDEETMFEMLKKKGKT